MVVGSYLLALKSFHCYARRLKYWSFRSPRFAIRGHTFASFLSAPKLSPLTTIDTLDDGTDRIWYNITEFCTLGARGDKEYRALTMSRRLVVTKQTIFRPCGKGNTLRKSALLPTDNSWPSIPNVKQSPPPKSHASL